MLLGIDELSECGQVTSNGVCHGSRSALVKAMACCLVGRPPQPKTELIHHQWKYKYIGLSSGEIQIDSGMTIGV